MSLSWTLAWGASGLQPLALTRHLTDEGIMAARAGLSVRSFLTLVAFRRTVCADLPRRLTRTIGIVFDIEHERSVQTSAHARSVRQALMVLKPPGSQAKKVGAEVIAGQKLYQQT